MRSFVILLGIMVLMPLLSIAQQGGGTYEQELSQLTADLSKRLDDAHLKTVAAVDFKDLQGKTTNLGRFLSDEVSTNLAMQDKSISMADRANLKRIMEENKLTEEGLVDPQNAKKLGQLAGLDAIMFGTVVPFGNGYRLNIKVITTDTAKIVVASRGSFSKSDTLDSLAGVNNEAASSDTTSDQEASDTPPPPKQKKYDLATAIVEIKSVEYFKKTKKVRVSYSVTYSPPKSGYAANPPQFAYHVSTMTADWHTLPEPEMFGEATDDNGAKYKIVPPLDVLSQPKISSSAPLGLELEFQLVESQATNQMPTKISFWFEFAAGFVVDARDQVRLSVSDYGFDKVH